MRWRDKQMKRRLRALRSPSFRDKLGEVLYREALKVWRLAQSRTPYRTGALMRSGKVHAPEVKGTKISVAITFGDDTVGYAVPVHERVHAHHPRGQSKFLESAIIDSIPKIEQSLGRKVNGALRGRGIRGF